MDNPDFDFDAIKRKVHAELFDFDAKYDQEGGSQEPDYQDGDGMIFPKIQEEDVLGPLAEDTRLQNLECRMVTQDAKYEVMAEYVKKLEKAIRELQVRVNQAAGAIGLNKVEMGK